jgi:hypothetical protein
MLPGGVQLGAFKRELGPPIGVARLMVEPNFFASLLAQGIALCRFSYLHAGLIAAASVPVGGHRRRRADREGDCDESRQNEERRGSVRAPNCLCHE